MQIRLVLLRFFPSYVGMFSHSQLEEVVLPLVLLGIRDVNDVLVSETLKALSLMVPILGASQVIGKKRKKMFADGSPGPSKPNINEQISHNSFALASSEDVRRSPIGAETSEDESQNAATVPAVACSDDWEPWELEQEDDNEAAIFELRDEGPVSNCSKDQKEAEKTLDFFADMQPVIEPNQKHVLSKFAQADEASAWNEVDDEAWS